MCSRGKTLTVQGLWVCKKTESLVEMHLQALELLKFRYAYKTVLNQSKQKKKREEKKGLKQCCVDGRSHPHFYSLIYNSCPVTSTNSPPCCLTPLCLWERETASEGEQKEERSLWADAHPPSDLIINQAAFDGFLIPLKNTFWTHRNRADGRSETLDNDTAVLFSHRSVRPTPGISNSTGW